MLSVNKRMLEKSALYLKLLPDFLNPDTVSWRIFRCFRGDDISRQPL